MLKINNVKTPRLDILNKGCKKEEIKNYFHSTFTLYELLFEFISNDDAYYIKADPLRHPLIFYFGHTAVFYINKLLLAGLIDNRINEEFESMLAIGVDEMGWDDLDEKNYDWPTVQQVKEYRNKARNIVDSVIDMLEISLPISSDSPAWVILMGIEHERIHLETSSVLIRQLPIYFVSPHYEWPVCPETSKPKKNLLAPVKGGKIKLGKSNNSSLYGWDNEYGEYFEDVIDFNASIYLVSNDEFLGFMNKGGYSKKEYWSQEGWDWKSYIKSEMPRFWLKKEGEYYLRLMAQEINMPWDWPCEINYHEAKAFCNWKSAKSKTSIRLPTEAEWYCLREKVDGDFDEWQKAPGNIDLNYYASSMPVSKNAFDGFFDVIGNVWQWTETTINGFDGFKVHPLYDDFSTPTFDNMHHIIKGGSWCSTGNEAIKHSRYAFRRHFYQHAGFRYIESKAPVKNQVNMYEEDPLIAQEMDFNFGYEHLKITNFHKKVIQICSELPGLKKRALDLGCSVGRKAFELGCFFEEVVGIDTSARFIKIAMQIQKNGKAKYQIKEEGDLCQYYEIILSKLFDIDKTANIIFQQGDLCNLDKKIGSYDLVVASNIIEKISDPETFLNNIDKFINSGGYLIITSTYTWQEKYTTKDNWLGGYKCTDGENVTTLSGIKKVLKGSYSLYKEPETLECIIKKTNRSFQHIFPEISIWQKK